MTTPTPQDATMPFNVDPDPEAAGLDADRLAEARRRLAEACAGEAHRCVIVRRGRVAGHWCEGIAEDARVSIASAAKSVYSNVLGIAVAEGRLASADERVVDHFPAMMAVREGEGNKPGRYAFEANREITFRHLICNTSGYMKPGEAPGKVFNYQSWGMNVLTHALAAVYGLYDLNDPAGCPGFPQLIREKIAEPIGADFDYSLGHPPFGDRLARGARLEVFGYYSSIHTTALDLARLGWLWCRRGRWGEQQIIPEPWMRQTTVTAPDILAHCPREQWCYGHGFWTNDRGVLWPDLPRSGYTAAGAGGHYITVFPDHELVVVQNPGPYHQGRNAARANPDFLAAVLDACPQLNASETTGRDGV